MMDFIFIFIFIFGFGFDNAVVRVSGLMQEVLCFS